MRKRNEKRRQQRIGSERQPDTVVRFTGMIRNFRGARPKSNYMGRNADQKRECKTTVIFKSYQLEAGSGIEPLYEDLQS
jgi:hypothetical protein